jgi:hypothetical protein
MAIALAWLGISEPAAAKPAIIAAVRNILRIRASLGDVSNSSPVFAVTF